MLDTDSVSFALRGHGKVGAELMKHRRSELCVSAITVAELRFGADKRASRKIHRAIESGSRPRSAAATCLRSCESFPARRRELVLVERRLGGPRKKLSRAGPND